jgi:hypothetical protein
MNAGIWVYRDRHETTEDWASKIEVGHKAVWAYSRWRPLAFAKSLVNLVAFLLFDTTVL